MCDGSRARADGRPVRGEVWTELRRTASSKLQPRWVTTTRPVGSLWLMSRLRPRRAQLSLRETSAAPGAPAMTLGPAHAGSRARGTFHDAHLALGARPQRRSAPRKRTTYARSSSSGSNALAARSRTREHPTPHRSDAIHDRTIQPGTAGRAVELRLLRAPADHARLPAAAGAHQRCQPVEVSPVRRAAFSAAAARRTRCSSRVFSATLGVSIGLLLALTSHDATLAHTGAGATTTSAHPLRSRDHGSIGKRASARSPVVTPGALAAD
jgi:hypothetical protein